MQSSPVADRDENFEAVSVKILLKQAYSAHIAKVRSLENELIDAKEKLLEFENSDKRECTRCSDMQKALESCRLEYTTALQEQVKKYDCLVEELASLKSKNCSSSKDSSLKWDAAVTDPQVDLKSADVKQAISTNCNTDSRNQKYNAREANEVLKEKSNSQETDKTLNFIGANVEDSFQSKSLKNKPGPSAAKNTKNRDFFSSLQNSFFDDSANLSDSVLVTETLDTLDEVPNPKARGKIIGGKEIGAAKCKSPKISSNVTAGKENIIQVQKSSDTIAGEENVKHVQKPLQEKRLSGKRSSSGSSNGDEQMLKKSKLSASNKTSRLNDNPVEVLTISSKAAPIDKAIKSGCNKGSDSAVNAAHSVKSNDNPVEVLTISSKAAPIDKTIKSGCNKSSDSAVNTAHSVKSNDKVTNTSENMCSFDINSKFFDVDQSFFQTSPSLLKPNKKTKSLFIPEISHNDSADFQKSINASKKESNESSKSKSSKNISKKASSIKGLKTTSRYKMTLDVPSLNFRKPKYKQTKLSKSIFQATRSQNEDDVIDLETDEDNSDNKSSLKEDGNDCNGLENNSNPPSENWGCGTLSTSEMDRLRNMTIDMDVTFAPDLISQKCKDSALSVSGAPLRTKGSVNRNFDFANMCNENSSSDFVDAKGKQVLLQGETSSSTAVPQSKNDRYNSFDRVPSPEMPNYKFKEDPVRNKEKRQQLKGFDCKECEKYYSALGISDEEKKTRLKQCSRHRAHYVPPATPEHFWELEFPDTQECKERGYLGDTQKVPLKSRRRRPLK